MGRTSEYKQWDAGHEQGHRQTAQRPREPGIDTGAQLAGPSLAILKGCTFGHDTTLQDGPFVLVEETELAGDLEDLSLVLDHIVAPHRSRLGTAILRDRTA